MSKTGIRNCDLALKQCDKYWSEFKKTSKKGIRFCLDCERLVQKVESTEELREVLKMVNVWLIFWKKNLH